jgi:hypothetical protein
MIAAAKRFKETGAVIGAGNDRIPHVQLASFEGLLPKTADWKKAGAPQEEAPATAK